MQSYQTLLQVSSCQPHAPRLLDNIFNPIHIEDVDYFLAQCQQVGEVNAVEDGIMDEARSNAEEDIRAMFNAAFGDAYKVEFVWEEA